MNKNNPYDFVPLGPAADRKAIATQEKFSGHSGTLTCRLQTLTHFFIAGNQERQARNQHQELRLLREDNAPIIPGSSLKGAIRHLAEALSGSCFILPNDPRMRAKRQDKLEYYDYQKRSSDAYVLPEGFSPCGLGEFPDSPKPPACPACRIFGFLADRVLSTGNVSFETAHVAGDYQTAAIILEPFGAPAPRHRPFYGTQASSFQEPRGRKFYYHRLQGARLSKKLDFNKTVEAILPGAAFEFTLQYQNLSDTDLSLLVYALALEDSMRHKFGMGKGVGLGSVHLTITGWQQLERRNRYLQFGGGTTNFSGADLQNAVKVQTDAYHRHYARWKDTLAALQDILIWDEQHPRDARYPARAWLKDNPAVALEDVPEGAADYGKRPATAAPRPFTPAAPRPEQEKAAAEAQKDAENLLRQLEKEKQSHAVQRQTAYQNNATEPKAQVELAAEDAWCVILPKLPEQHFKLKRKPDFSKAVAGTKIRVRVVVDGNGHITRAEEL